MSTSQRLVTAVIVVLMLSLLMSALVTWVQAKARQRYGQGVEEATLRPSPGGQILGLLECFFYLTVLSVDGLAYLAGAWLAFKLATKWQSAPHAKPSPAETQVGYRAFQVGTIGNLLVGVLGAAILRLHP